MGGDTPVARCTVSGNLPASAVASTTTGACSRAEAGALLAQAAGGGDADGGVRVDQPAILCVHLAHGGQGFFLADRTAPEATR